MAMRQRYVSNELTHFVGRRLPEDKQYQLLVNIMTSGWLTHPPHEHKLSGNALMINVGKGRISENDMYLPHVICFCDIPIADLQLQMKKYGRFGIAFLKPFLIQRGANPVFYIAKNSMVQNVSRPEMFDDIREDMAAGPGKVMEGIRRGRYLNRMLQEYIEVFLFRVPKALGREQERPGIFPSVPELDALHRFLDFHIFSFVKVFDDSQADEHPDNYYMEREWRMLGNLNFELGDVRRVIMPESYARQFRTDVPDYVGQVSFAD